MRVTLLCKSVLFVILQVEIHRKKNMDDYHSENKKN